MKFYKSGTKWVLDALTLDSGTCYKVESSNGNRMEIKSLSDHRSLTGGCLLYTDYTNLAGTAYTKEQINLLLEDFLNPNVGLAGGCVAVTGHDENLLPHVGWFEVRGDAGNVAFVDAYGNASLVLAFDVKESSKCRVRQILSTGTTATDIYLYY
jgi:hypothetical protein